MDQLNANIDLKLENTVTEYKIICNIIFLHTTEVQNQYKDGKN